MNLDPMANHINNRRVLNTVLATCLVAAAGLLVAPIITRWYADQLATRLEAKIDAAEDSEVKIPLRQLANLGQPAIEPLVKATASQRTTIAITSRQILEEQVARLIETAKYQKLSDSDAEAATIIAAALANHIDNFGPAGKQWAEGISLAMIELSEQISASRAGKLLEDCSRVLAAVPPQGKRVRTISPSVPTANIAMLADPDIPAPVMVPMTRSSEHSLELLADIESKPMRMPKFNAKRNAFSAQASGSKPPMNNNSDHLNWSNKNDSSGTRSLEDAKPLPVHAPRMVEVSESTNGSGSRGTNSRASSGVVSIPTPDEMDADAKRLSHFSSEALFLKLEDASRYRAATIRSLLVKRGFDPKEIQLRLRMVTVGDGQRLRLTESISELPATSATRMWRWLTTNDSADVRLRALTALATTQSPNLTAIARDLATNDQDPRVAKLASQLIR